MKGLSAEVVFCFISSIAAIATVVVAYSNNKKQMQISMFAECTRRYQEIMLHIRQREQDKLYYQTLYIDLCSEEFFLYKEGFLPKSVWAIWKDGMTHEVKDDMSYKFLWERDKKNYNPQFQDFFNEIITNNSKHI